jgi:hypothetical protein
MGMFSLLAKLGLDTVAFEVGAKRAQSMATKLGSNLKGAITSQLGAALGVASVIGFTKSVINLADEIGDLSEQMNISTDDVQRLQVVAGQTGVKFETIAKGLVNLGQARLKAVESAGKERTAFESLGLSLDEVNNASITNITTAQKLQMAYEASGKSAGSQAAMIEIFGVKAYQAGLALNGLKTLGPIDLIEKDQIDKLGALNDKLAEQYRILQTNTVPALIFATEHLNNFIEAGKVTPLVASLRLAYAAFQSRSPKPPPFEGPMPPTPEEIAAGKTLGTVDSGTKPDKIKNITALQSLGQNADSFAKIGLFGGFQSSQDRMIKELQTQANYLKYIQRASEKTADAVGQ